MLYYELSVDLEIYTSGAFEERDSMNFRSGDLQKVLKRFCRHFDPACIDDAKDSVVLYLREDGGRRILNAFEWKQFKHLLD